MRTIDVRSSGRKAERIPAETGFAELDELSATYERLSTELREDEAHVQALTGDLEKSRRESLDKTAEAMISGSTKPKNGTALATLENKLADAQETSAARERALDRVGSQIVALIAERAAAWTREIEQAMQPELERWQSALDALEAQAQRLSDLWNRRSWASAAASGNARAKSGDLLVRGLMRRDGTPYALAGVLAELRLVGQPVEPIRRKSMNELEAERQERVRRANEREAAFAKKAEEMSAA